MFNSTMKVLGASLAILTASLFSSTGMADTCGSYTYTLANGQTANADQVMTNFNNIKGCIPTVAGGSGTASTLVLQPTTGAGTTGADIIFKNGNNGATEAMRILNSGLVGIGTSAPTAKLTIDAGATKKMMLGQMSTGSTWNVVSLNGDVSGGGATGLIAGDNADAGLYIQNGASASILFRNPGGTRLVIDSGGNVGIGTTVPGDDLDIQKSSTGSVISRVYNTSNGTAAAARFDLATGVANAYTIFQIQNNSNNPYLQIGVDSGVTAGQLIDSQYFIFSKTY